MLLVSFIICREIFKNPEFHEWFTKNTVNAVMVSSLSLIHIECLKLLDARVAGFGNLNAPFSKVAEGLILWGVMCTIFICDLPQLAVQIIYRSSVKNYDIIPFLTLIMGVITIFQNIMILIFNLMNSLSKNSQLKDGKSRSIGNASSNIQQRPEIKAHRSFMAMGPIENEIEYYEDDELKDANSREFNNERDSAVIKKIEKEKRVSIIENRNTFVEEKGVIITIGNIDDSENNTVKDDDNTCTSIMVERNTKVNN
ncbi:13151_t:CDS:2 [Dentiscutata erythropus]|uniref:13151_t:CDS:1 n=1 Tax=Dentiscutata erythropus TaxID=1348616 RepID=A0A9N9DBE1_9GLOM|nr:13151_t:CDS:2 [Dentiscutata erythropus]